MGDVYSNIDRDKAIRYYDTSLVIDPKIAAAYFGKGIIYDLENKIDSAILMYQKALSLSEWNQSYLGNLAYQYYKKGDFEQAINKHYKSMQLNNKYVLNIFGLSSAYRASGNLDAALHYYNYLIVLINNDRIMENSNNSRTWFWNAGTNPVYFYDLPMKKSYAYYSIGLTAYLIGEDSLADNYIEKAKKLDRKYKGQVANLIFFDIMELSDYYSSFTPRLDEFIIRYK